jgi:predicted AAA+ superfamily ATPase
VDVLDRFYLTFSLKPWSSGITRAIHKECKTYLFDYALVPDQAARFENLIAVELLRAVAAWKNLGYGDFGLHYVRTKEKREVDFLLSEGRKPLLLVEVKLTDDTPSPNLQRFQNALGVPAVQLLAEGTGFKRLENSGRPLLVVPAAWWLPKLP